jgi:hypothetical protein
MSALFKKLNLKDQPTVVVLNAPQSFDAELAQLTDRTILRAVTRSTRITFGMGFAVTQTELDAVSKQLVAGAEGDAVIWMAYPKQTSKRYACEFNRDSGWTVLGEAGFEGVRMVAIDADWSALRFRRVEHVLRLKRDVSRALSTEGKARARRPER